MSKDNLKVLIFLSSLIVFWFFRAYVVAILYFFEYCLLFVAMFFGVVLPFAIFKWRKAQLFFWLMVVVFVGSDEFVYFLSSEGYVSMYWLRFVFSYLGVVVFAMFSVVLWHGSRLIIVSRIFSLFAALIACAMAYWPYLRW